MTRPFRAGATFLLIAVATLSGAAYADDQDTIDYRGDIMQSLGEQTAAIEQILQHQAPADNLALHAQSLVLIAAMAKKAFEPNVAGGESKPEVWTNWADFSKRLDELVADTQAVARAGKDSGAAAAPMLAVAHSCQDCHDIYREQKK